MFSQCSGTTSSCMGLTGTIKLAHTLYCLFEPCIQGKEYEKLDLTDINVELQQSALPFSSCERERVH